MMKNKKIVAIFALLLFMVSFTTTIKVEAASNWTDLGSGYSARWDGPSAGDDGRYHVHVYKGKKQIGSERCGGGESHGDELDSVPNKVKEKVRKDKKYKQGGEKNQDLDEAEKKIEAKKLDLNYWKDILVAIGIVVACTATFFFAGDDIWAWANLIRAICAG